MHGREAHGSGPGAGIVVGSLAASVIGAVATSFFEVSGVDGDYQVALVMRRRSDRVPVIERHVEGGWHTSHNAWTATEKVNFASDEAVAKLELDIVKTLKAMQAELQTVSP